MTTTGKPGGLSLIRQFQSRRWIIWPTLHQLNFNYKWEWSAVDPDVLYFLNGNQLSKYNKSTQVVTNLEGLPNGDPVSYHVAVVGQDNLVCSAAGSSAQDTYTKLFRANPNSSSQSKLIDIANKTINGISQADPNWRTGEKIGIHSIFGRRWWYLAWGHLPWAKLGQGGGVLNLATNSWACAIVFCISPASLPRGWERRQWERSTNGKGFAWGDLETPII